jgi:hypothetical protein
MRVAEGRERPEGARGRSQRGDSEVERPVKRPVPGWIHPKYVGYASCTPTSSNILTGRTMAHRKFHAGWGKGILL